MPDAKLGHVLHINNSFSWIKPLRGNQITSAHLKNMKTPRCFIGNRFFSIVRIASAGTLISAAAAMALFAASPGSPTISGTGMSIGAPDDVATTSLPITPVCTTPSPVHTYAWYHCYTPIDIRTAYGV